MRDTATNAATASLLAVALLMVLPILPTTVTGSAAWNAAPPTAPSRSVPTVAVGPSAAVSPDARGSVYAPYAPRPSVTSTAWVAECGFTTTGNPACGNSPIKLNGAKATFDNATGNRYIVMFGGTASSGAAINATYQWKLGNWSTLYADGQTALPAPARATNASLTYDGTDGYVLEMGGWNPTTAVGVAQTYSFVGGVWTKQVTPAGVTGRGGACLAWVPTVGGKGGYVLLFGGSTKTALISTTWKYTAGTWTNITATVGTAPSARTNMACAWDPVTSTVDMFGGWTGAHTVANDLWRFAPQSGTTGTWFSVIANNTAGSPPARQLSSMWYDSQKVKMDLFSGARGDQLKAPSQLAGGFDMWTLLGATNTTWANITASNINILTPYAGGLYATASTYAPPYAYGWTYGGKTVGGATTLLTAEWTARVTGALSVAPPSPQLNKPIWFNASATGGTGIYHYNWTGLPPPCAPANLSSITCSPTIGGTYNVSVNITDSASSPWPSYSALYNATVVIPAPLPPAFVGGNLTVGGFIGNHPSNTFWGLVSSPPYNVNYTGGAYTVGAYLNSTPFRQYRIGGGGLGYDPTTNLNWVAPVGGGAFVNTGPIPFSLTAFKAWYPSLTFPSGKSWLFYLPAMTNTTTFAVSTAAWFHNTLGLAPTMWQFGNEPEAWTHYGLNYSSWNTADASAPTALAYATMVKNYAVAVHAAFPADKFIGIEAASAYFGSATFIAQVITTDYPYIHALAFHLYPPPNQTNPYGAIGAYYSTLTASRGILAVMAQMRSLLSSNCGGNATCLALPIQIGEYEGGPAGNQSVYDGLYQGAAWMAASATLALKGNVSSLQLFNIGRVIKNGIVGPQGLLYQRILTNMTMGRTFSANVTGPSAGGGLFAVVTANGSARSLLVVNTNLTHAVNITVGNGFPRGVPGSTWTWNPTVAFPAKSSFAALPTVYSVPSQGILLVDNFNGVPNAPANTTVSLLNATRAVLGWNRLANSTGVVSDTITTWTNGFCLGTPSSTVVIGATLFTTVGSLVAGTTYGFTVTESNATGSGAPSACVPLTLGMAAAVALIPSLNVWLWLEIGLSLLAILVATYAIYERFDA